MKAKNLVIVLMVILPMILAIFEPVAAAQALAILLAMAVGLWLLAFSLFVIVATVFIRGERS